MLFCRHSFIVVFFFFRSAQVRLVFRVPVQRPGEARHLEQRRRVRPLPLRGRPGRRAVL